MKKRKMEIRKIKDKVVVARELSEGYMDLLKRVNDMRKELGKTRKLWRSENKSKLVRTGLTLIAIPEPTPVTEMAGIALLAAGAIQKKIQSRTLYVDDVYKLFREIVKEVDFKG